jgi:hypothetical protein
MDDELRARRSGDEDCKDQSTPSSSRQAYLRGVVRATALVALLLAWALAGPGCATTHGPPSDSLAAVEIKGRSPLEIARVLSDVFEKAGYVPAALPPNSGENMLFEKKGNAGETLLYGDWSAKRVWYRVKIQITLNGPDSEIVSCDAFRVLNHGDPHFEEEQKLSSLRRGTYQHLLNKAKAQLNSGLKQPTSVTFKSVWFA